MINKNYTKKIYNEPFPYVIFNNFFEKEYYDEVARDFPKIQTLEKEKNNVGRMHHDITNGDKVYKDLIKKSDAYKKMHDWVYSKNFIDFFSSYIQRSDNNKL